MIDPEEMAKARAWVERQQRVPIGAADRGRRRMSKRYRRKEAARLLAICPRCCGGGVRTYYGLFPTTRPYEETCDVCEGKGKRA